MNSFIVVWCLWISWCRRSIHHAWTDAASANLLSESVQFSLEPQERWVTVGAQALPNALKSQNSLHRKANMGTHASLPTRRDPLQAVEKHFLPTPFSSCNQPNNLKRCNINLPWVLGENKIFADCIAVAWQNWHPHHHQSKLLWLSTGR